LRIAVLLATVISLMGLILACPDTGSSSDSGTTIPPSESKKTPVADDFTVSGNRNVDADGSPKSLSVTAKPERTTGTITVKYKDVADANGSPTPNAPSAIGLYEVTIDVTGTDTWNPVNGLLVASLNIKNPGKTDPVRDDFNIPNFNLSYTESTVPATPAITAKSGKTTGTITVKYNGTARASLPSTEGNYVVTFDVGADSNYNAAVDFPAGLVIVTKTDSGGGGGGDVFDIKTLKASDFNYVIYAYKNDGKTTVTLDSKTLKNENDTISIDYQDIQLFVDLAPNTTDYPMELAKNKVIQYWDWDWAAGAGTMIAAPKNAKPRLKFPTFPQGQTPPAADPDKGYKVFITLEPVVDLENKKAWGELVLNLEFKINQRTPVASDYVIDWDVQSEAGQYLGGDIKVQHIKFDRKKIHPNLDDTQTLSTLPLPNATDAQSNGQYTGTVFYANAGYPKSAKVPTTAGTYTVTFQVPASDTPGDSSSGTATNYNWLKPEELTCEKSLVLKELQPVYPAIRYKFWIDDNDDILKVDKKQQFITQEESAVITFVKGEGVEVVEWREDGVVLYPGKTDTTYTFNTAQHPNTAIGWHWVSLTVSKQGKYYTERAEIRIQTKNVDHQ